MNILIECVVAELHLSSVLGQFAIGLWLSSEIASIHSFQVTDQHPETEGQRETKRKYLLWQRKST